MKATILNLLMGMLIILMFCGALYFVIPAFVEYRQAKATQQRIERDLAEKREQLQELHSRIHALRTDANAIERVAREKFGWCGPDEKIYHFDQPARLPQREFSEQ